MIVRFLRCFKSLPIFFLLILGCSGAEDTIKELPVFEVILNLEDKTYYFTPIAGNYWEQNVIGGVEFDHSYTVAGGSNYGLGTLLRVRKGIKLYNREENIALTIGLGFGTYGFGEEIDRTEYTCEVDIGHATKFLIEEEGFLSRSSFENINYENAAFIVELEMYNEGKTYSSNWYELKNADIEKNTFFKIDEVNEYPFRNKNRNYVGSNFDFIIKGSFNVVLTNNSNLEEELQMQDSYFEVGIWPLSKCD